ncbi:MAG: hypothetical protein HFI34_01875 [Lachnospiraceae bacterium]|nr:hypothetical protein [Lachnospiraceae bacterium]
MNQWMEKLRTNKKIVIGGIAVFVLAAVVIFLLLSGSDRDDRSSTGIHTAGEGITTKQEKELWETSEQKTTRKHETTTETTGGETGSGESTEDTEESSSDAGWQESTKPMESTESRPANSTSKPQNPQKPAEQSTVNQQNPTTGISTGENQEPVTNPQINPEPPQTVYEYKIPVIHINTENKVPVTSNSQTVMAEFSLDGRNTGYPDIKNAVIKIRGRGHSTWKLDKKPYQIKFEEKTSVMGMKEAKRYILLANYSDKTLMRNHIAFTMAEKLNHLIFVPHTKPVDVYLNGTYIGVYGIGEKIEVRKGRIEMEMGSEFSADTGYLLEVGGFDDEDDGYVFNTDCLKEVVVKTPEYEVINREQEQYIEDYVNKAEQAVKNLSGYEEYIDIPSLIDWFILHELTYNLDCCFNRSCYLVKPAGGKLQMGPPWDFDVAFGNYIYDNPNYDGWASVGSSDSSSYIKVTWMNYLLADSRFNARVKQRWAEKKEELVSVAMAEIESTKDRIYKSQMDNFKVWDIWDIRAGYGSDAATALHSFEEQVEYLKSFIRNRKQWMDQAISNLP